MNVIEAVFATHDLLDEMGVGHAFGGALALNYYGEPRFTHDVDVNVFLPWSDAGATVERFAEIDFVPLAPATQWRPVSGVRLREPAGLTPVDLFFSIDEEYRGIPERVKAQPFGPAEVLLPFLSVEDLVMFKVSFGRPKDWSDLDRLAQVRTPFDIDAIEERLIALRGPTMYPRLVRLRALVKRTGPA